MCAKDARKRTAAATIETVTTPDRSGRGTPSEELAREAAEAHAYLAQAAADPRLPRRERTIFRAAGDMSPVNAAAGIRAEDSLAGIRAEDSLAGIREKYSEMSAILFGDDMAKLAAVLRKRLTREQLADLIVKLYSPA